MHKSAFIAFSALFLLAGCGGSSSTPAVQTTAYAGSYGSNLTSPASSALLVDLLPNGSATAVIADSTGILASGSGTVSGNKLTIDMTGSAGAIQVATTFGANSSAVSQVTGAVTDSNLSDSVIAGAGLSPFAGTYQVSFTGSDSGTGNFTITPSGGVTGSGKDNAGNGVSFVATSQLSSAITFSGSVTTGGGTVTNTFTGSLFLINVNLAAGSKILGSGSWASTSKGSGAWTASNDIG